MAFIFSPKYGILHHVNTYDTTHLSLHKKRENKCAHLHIPWAGHWAIILLKYYKSAFVKKLFLVLKGNSSLQQKTLFNVSPGIISMI